MANEWYTVPHDSGLCAHSCMRCANYKGEMCDECYDTTNANCWYIPKNGIHKITLESSRIYEGRTYEELVCKLAKDVMDIQGMGQYMHGVAHRCKIWDGTEIKVDNCRNFVDNLIRLGIITKYEVCEAY